MAHIARLTLFTRAFCHTRVKNFLKGTDEAAESRTITFIYFLFTRAVVAKMKGAIHYSLISKKILTADLEN